MSPAQQNQHNALRLFLLGGFVVFALSLSAQTNELCEGPPYSFEGAPLPPLCEQYGTQNYPLQIGVGSASGIVFSSQLPNPVTNQNIEMVGNFFVNTHVTFDNVTMKISPNVAILVQNTSTSLTFNNCRLFCCNALWKGIEATGEKETIRMTGNTRVEDAETAIKSVKKKSTAINLDEATFNRNVTGIYLEGEDAYTASESPKIVVMVNTSFTVTSPLYQNAIPLYGIRTKNVLLPLSQFQAMNENNTFSRLLHGIYAEGNQTRLFVLHHQYTDISRIGIYFTGGNLLDVRYSDFENCRYSVSTFNAEGLNCFYNTFTLNTSSSLDRAMLIVRQPRANHFLNVKNCSFSVSNPQTGFVTCFDVRTNPAVPTRMEVIDNTFNLLNLQAKPSTGVKITGELIAGSDVNLEKGNIFNVNPTIQTFFNFGIVVSGGLHRNGLRITNSEFYCSGTGIRLDGSVIGEDNQVSENRFHTLDATTGIGMDIVAFEGLMLCDNEVRTNSLRTNYHFRGQSMSTNFVGNTTQSGFFIIRADGIIGQQMDKGNLWRPVLNPDGTAAYRPRVTNNNMDLNIVQGSKFIVNEPQSILNPGTNTYTYLSELHPFDVTPDVFPLEDAFFDDGGGTQNPSCVVGTYSTADFGDVAVAQGTFGSWFGQPAVGWDAEQYLYRKLNLYPAYAAAHSAFPAFLNTRANTSVGKIFNLEQKVLEAGTMPGELANQAAALQSEIAAIEAEIAALPPSDPPSAAYLDLLEEQREKIEALEAVTAQFAAHAASKLAEAWNMLPNIATSNAYEWNKKRVYEIHIGSRLFQSDTFTQAQIADLKTIGQQCIEDGGKAVLLARGLLGECDYADIRETVEACYPPEEERAVSAQSQKILAEVSVNPNPADDFVSLKAPRNGVLSIYTIEGKLRQQTSFSAGESQLPLNLPSGLYFFHCQMENNAASVLKVAIQH